MCMYIYIYICINLSIYLSIYLYICIYIHIHTKRGKLTPCILSNSVQTLYLEPKPHQHTQHKPTQHS